VLVKKQGVQNPKNMKKYFKLKNLLILLVLILILIQFYRPAKNISTEISSNSILTAVVVPQEVEQILKTSCYDCHSNNTVYPWYNNIAPVSWWLDHHVKEGKKELNFDEWANYTDKRKNHKLKEIKEQTEEKEMPLKSYLWIHNDAKLSDSQIKTLVDWARILNPDIDKEEVSAEH